MNLFLFLSFIILIGFAGCAAEKKAEINLIWPLPPDPPRVKYVRSLEGAKDVQPKKGLFKRTLDFLFGEEELPRLIQPYGIYAGKEGMVYVADTGLQVIHRLDLEGKTYRQIFKIPGGILRSPIGIALDAAGNLFVSDSELGRIFQFSPNGGFLKALGTPLKRPTGLAMAPDRQTLYVIDTGEHHVLAFNLKGEKLFEFGKRGHGEGEFNFPTHIAVDAKRGDLFIADSMNFRVQQFSPEGKFIKQFGSSGARLGSFSKMKGIAVDIRGIIYVVDGLFDTVQMFNSKGELLMNFGKAGNREGEFWLPGGIAVEGDLIYVADTYNKRVQVFRLIDAAGAAFNKVPGSVTPEVRLS